MKTAAREQSETLMSARQLSAHTDTYTLNTETPRSNQETARGNWLRLKLKIISIKHKWKERSSSSTSVQNQLAQLKDELENIRVSLIPKLNSIQATQMNQAEHIASTIDSHAQLANYSLQMDYLQGQIFHPSNTNQSQ